MTSGNDTTRRPDELAELLVHIGRSARGEDSGAELTAAQWTALRFFARANSASRTPSAFASFQATTRGTASQTIKALEARGLLSRRRSERDGRSVQFEVTGPGHEMLAQDPLRHLTAALAGLTAGDRAALERLLPALSADLAQQRGSRAFGTCDDCTHYENRPCGGYCACVASDLAPGDIGRLCANFAPGPAVRDATAPTNKRSQG
ncbi:MarR family winged helix-turn-helix transcriptional regulator [Roseovarius sp. SYSU LYC5161]|jgi:DNA-binding MarR family transcriptional regulator|uniref:MarR family winged helix-turn-helix transcriptional regulator n=1 Tax=Roseovarius halophilus (ex Wu et al. 2025) TaxID=3376060 RepID=UPI0028725C5F|nr:MarR family transcriptional regulator [Roseovarius sp.]